MSLDENQIEATALNLQPRSRAKLAEKLLKSLDALSDAEIEAMWLEEAERHNERRRDRGHRQARPEESGRMIIVPDASVILKWVLEKEDEPDHRQAFRL